MRAGCYVFYYLWGLCPHTPQFFCCRKEPKRLHSINYSFLYIQKAKALVFSRSVPEWRKLWRSPHSNWKESFRTTEWSTFRYGCEGWKKLIIIIYKNIITLTLTKDFCIFWISILKLIFAGTSPTSCSNFPHDIASY